MLRNSGRPPALVLALLLPLAAACSGDASRPTAPAAALAPSAAADRSIDRMVNLMDACDPTTFNAVLGPGGCIRQGGVTFADFIAQVTAHGSAGAWHFAPPTLNAAVGQTLVAVNRGGETHTFTEVAHFGGGIVPALNRASGNPVPAAECLALGPGDFIPAGTTHTVETLDDPGTELYQCCIHPWMRTEVHVASR